MVGTVDRGGDERTCDREDREHGDDGRGGAHGAIFAHPEAAYGYRCWP